MINRGSLLRGQGQVGSLELADNERRLAWGFLLPRHLGWRIGDGSHEDCHSFVDTRGCVPQAARFRRVPGVCSKSVKPWAHTLATCVDRYCKLKRCSAYMLHAKSNRVALAGALVKFLRHGPILSNEELATSSRLSNKQGGFLVGAAAFGSTVEQGSLCTVWTRIRLRARPVRARNQSSTGKPRLRTTTNPTGGQAKDPHNVESRQSSRVNVNSP